MERIVIQHNAQFLVQVKIVASIVLLITVPTAVQVKIAASIVQVLIVPFIVRPKGVGKGVIIRQFFIHRGVLTDAAFSMMMELIFAARTVRVIIVPGNVEVTIAARAVQVESVPLLVNQGTAAKAAREKCVPSSALVLTAARIVPG